MRLGELSPAIGSTTARKRLGRGIGSGLGKTRQAVGDACYLAYPIRYNSHMRQWEQTGSCEKVLFIMTEQTMKQVRKMILAYLSDINESRFKLGNFSAEEQKILDQAADYGKICGQLNSCKDA